MVNEYSSDIVRERRQASTADGDPVELLIFSNDLTLAISPRALAVYRKPQQFGDPLGNGLVASVTLPSPVVLRAEDGRLVDTIQSGCVNLLDGGIVLILPNEARLYTDRESALHNRTPVVAISLAGEE